MYLLDLFEDKRYFNRLRAALFAAVLLVSAVLPFLFSLDRQQMLLAAIIGAGAVIILLRWPPLGLLALIAAGLLVRFSIGTGTGTRINIAVLMLAMLIGLWIFQMVAYERKFQLAPSRTVIPLVGFSIVAVLALLAGQLPWFIFASQKASLVAQIGGLALMLLSVGAYLLVGNQVRDLRWLEAMTWLFLSLGGFYMLTALLPPLWDIGLFQAGAFGSVFWVWFVSLSFSQLLFNRRLQILSKLALAALLLAAIYVSFIENRDWTSGWLPSFVAIVTILFVSGSRWFWLSLPVGLAVAATKSASISRLLLGGDNEYSLFTRLEAWRIMVEIIKVSPLIGLGPANYYWYTPLFSILGYHVQFNSHNNYVDIIAQTGLIGLAFFCWFAWAAWRMGWELRPKVTDGFAKAYVYGALGGLAGSLFAGMLGDWLLPFIYNIGYTGFRASMFFWLFMGGLLAMRGMVQETGSDEAPAEVAE